MSRAFFDLLVRTTHARRPSRPKSLPPSLSVPLPPPDLPATLSYSGVVAPATAGSHSAAAASSARALYEHGDTETIQLEQEK